MENSPALFPVLDIAGVEGVFVMDANSRVVAINCKPIFSVELVQNAALRVTTLFGALSEYLRPAQEVTLAFEHFQMVLRMRDGLLMAVIVQGQVNQVALKLACNVALKKLQEGPAPTMRSNAPAIPAATSRPQPAAPRPNVAPTTRPAVPRPTPPPRPGPSKSSGIWG